MRPTTKSKVCRNLLEYDAYLELIYMLKQMNLRRKANINTMYVQYSHLIRMR